MSVTFSPLLRFRSCIRVSALVLVLAAALAAGCDKGREGDHVPVPNVQPPPPAVSVIPVYRARVVAEFPHDTSAFTEGLIFRNGYLYESTGLQGKSSLRKVDLKSGEVVKRLDLYPDSLFGEGLEELHGRLFQLTWRSGIGFVYNADTFQALDTFRFYGEGWGLTSDSNRLVMSDGTEYLRFLDPKSGKVEQTLGVHYQGRPLESLNELEYINGEIWANVWQTQRIARIDPATGDVRSWVDLSGLLRPEITTGREDVLNGIAYDSTGKRIFVTGKNWSRVFQIEVEK